MHVFFLVFFFFQAEDGIRDYKVTGVQTCALPISTSSASRTSCVTKIAVLPISRRSARNWRCSSTRVTGSSAPNGSSKSRIGGAGAGGRGTAARRRRAPGRARGGGGAHRGGGPPPRSARAGGGARDPPAGRPPP